MSRLFTIMTATAAVIVMISVLVAQEAEEKKTIELKGGMEIPMEKIFEHITEITGRDFIVAPAITGRMIKIPNDTKANFEMLESLLKLNGITLQVVTEGDKTFYKALTDREIRELRFEDAKLYSEDDKLPEENVFMIVSVKIKYRDAVQMERMLTNRLVDRQGPGTVVSIGHDMVLLKDFAPMVAEYIRIIREVDKPSDEEARIVELKNANPDEIMNSLDKSTESGKYKGVYTDNKNRRLVIVGEKAELDDLEKVISLLDTKAGKRGLTIKLYPLENASAYDIVKAINLLLTDEEKERGFVATSAGARELLAVRADNPMHEQMEKFIKAIDVSDK